MRRFMSLFTAAVATTALVAVPLAQSAGAKPAPAGSPSVTNGQRAAGYRAHGGHPHAAMHAAHPAAPARSTIPGVSAAGAAEKAARNGTVKVTVTGSAGSVARAVTAAGGRVLASTGGESTAVLPKAALASVARAAGVSGIDAVNHPFTDGSPTATGDASNASTWHPAGQTGTGVKVAIVDVGFGSSVTEYNSEVTAGHLGATTQVINEDCTNALNTPTPYDDPHGLAVAEIVQAQAPNAQLYLYCVNSRAAVAAAEAAIEAAGIKLVSSSLSWFQDARGDGSGPAGSVADTVAKARKHGILWMNSTGNYNFQHWSGSLTDSNRDHYIDIGNNNPNVSPYESDFFTQAGGSPSAPTALDFEFQWDHWPTANTSLVLELYGVQCTSNFGLGGVDGCNGVVMTPGSPTVAVASTLGGIPVISADTSAFANTSSFDQIWEVQVRAPAAFATGAHYDLWGLGPTDGASELACPTFDPVTFVCGATPAAATSSVTSPANSPFAMGIGAANVGDGTTATGTLERFSSDGPTIDARVKPDLAGWDGDLTNVTEFGTRFYGTSAAAPSVAGAAALVAGLHATWDVSQIQNFLQQRANSGSPSNPPVNSVGYGRLTLGNPSTTALPAGGYYHGLAAPVRILDTRNTTGGHHAQLNSGTNVTVTLPTLPDDATAVAINLTGIKAARDTYLSVFPGGTAWPHTSNLNLTSADSTAAVFAIVSVNALKSITVRNNFGLVDVAIDEIGYFQTTPVTGGQFTALPNATRVLDTRNTTGGHFGKLASNATVTVNPGVPAGATAAIVNITSVNSTTSSGFLAAAPACSKATSTLNFNTFARANLAVVGLSGAGTFCISNNTGGTDVFVDVLGYMGASGATYVGLPAPQRIMDTRTGNGPVPPKALGSGQQNVVVGSGVGAVPSDATALLLGAVEASATGSGYLQVFPGTSRIPGASTLNFTPGRIVPNAAIVGLGASSFGVFNNIGSTQAAADLFGYFR